MADLRIIMNVLSGPYRWIWVFHKSIEIMHGKNNCYHLYYAKLYHVDTRLLQSTICTPP
jgi:hypothetical protein